MHRPCMTEETMNFTDGSPSVCLEIETFNFKTIFEKNVNS